ncbi:hypothetical protein GIB67_042700 [Kingdonia uniflora]|uniref:J domain-containing protein n=1 Tax=Kingdonia uniflora TaxID=39325 RepID=A0A7J7NDZ4_9MAGN|nr:hypothetical protein GIB67_042700 [Kingdonia uniflora]
MSSKKFWIFSNTTLRKISSSLLISKSSYSRVRVFSSYIQFNDPPKAIYKFPLIRRVYSNSFSSNTLNLSDKCWNCGAVAVSKPFLACESCRSVQPVDDSIDFFQIFGLEKAYVIEYKLDSKYKDWQKKLHPDLVHTKSEKEKEYAAEQSALVIDAYRTLRKPLSRAIYMDDNMMLDKFKR